MIRVNLTPIHVGDQPIRNISPEDLFRFIAQLQPKHRLIWAKSFARWHRKNALAGAL